MLSMVKKWTGNDILNMKVFQQSKKTKEKKKKPQFKQTSCNPCALPSILKTIIRTRRINGSRNAYFILIF